MRLYFVSSNENKFRELQSCLNCPIHLFEYDLLEIQGTSEEIMKHKLEEAYKILNHEKGFFAKDLILIDDSCLNLKGLYGFPGVYAKDFLKIGFSAIHEIVSKVGNEAKSSCQLGLLYNDQMLIFEGQTDGYIGPYKKGNGFGYDSIMFVNDMRLADLTIVEKNSISARGKACENLLEFLNKREIINKLE